MRVLGREHELATINGRLERLVAGLDGSGCIVVEAPAGSGKSTLLRAVLELPVVTSMHVLRCAPTAAERDLPYAALADLVADLVNEPNDADGEEPGAERWRAVLERALAGDADRDADRDTDPAGAAGLDARSVGRACRDAWSAIAVATPVLVVVDDAQWLDTASAAAVAYAVRRLPAAGVLVVAARRTVPPMSSSATSPGSPEAVAFDLGGDSMPLSPLPAPIISAIVTEWTNDRARMDLAAARTGTTQPLDGRRLRAIVDAAEGNPLYAVELARSAMTARHDRDLLTVPPSVEELLGHRLSEFALDVSLALAAVALQGRPTVTMLRRLDLLEPLAVAERAGVVDTSSGRAVYAHPLLAAVALQRTAAIDRRTLHRRLAEAADDPFDRVLHAARAAEQPDEALAAELAELADEMRRRGARDHAAELAGLALELTPADRSVRPARAVTAARLSFQCGDSALAAEQLSILDTGPTTPTRDVAFRAALVHATMAFSSGTAASAQQFAVRALDLCEQDVDRIEVLSLLARISYDDFDRSAVLARQALDLAERTPVPTAVMASALVARATTDLMTGEGLDRVAFDRAIELERIEADGGGPGYAPDSAYGSLAVLLKVTDELDEARAMLLTMLASNDDDGAEPYVRSHLPQLELWAGNWDAAEDHAHRHLDAAVRTGQHEQAVQARANLASIELHRGDLDAARATAEELRRSGAAAGDAWTERSGLGVLGAVAMAEGDAELAVELLGGWHRLAEQMGLREPGYCRFDADYVEALVSTGRLDAAGRHADLMAQRAEHIGRHTATAIAQRVQALVAGATGDRDRAVSLGRRAVESLAASPLVVEHARALLTLGQIHRRFKEKAAARDALTAALQIFERLGAEHFAERARTDLGRLGLRPAAGLGLTATEQRVAESAATGKTMRQVADELFMSPKTAEANLSRVYRKLGVGSRAELATWFAERRHQG